MFTWKKLFFFVTSIISHLYSSDAQSAGCSNQAQDSTEYVVVLRLNPDNLMLKTIIEAFKPFGGREQPYMRFQSKPGESVPFSEAKERLSELKITSLGDQICVFSDELNKQTPIESFGESNTRKGLRASVIKNNSQTILERIFGKLQFNTELIFLDPKSVARGIEEESMIRKILNSLSTQAKLVEAVRTNWRKDRPLLVSAITVVLQSNTRTNFTKEFRKICPLIGYDLPYDDTPYKEEKPKQWVSPFSYEELYDYEGDERLEREERLRNGTRMGR